MATIVLKRIREYVGVDFHIYIDAQKVGTIANGQVKEFEAAPGRHTLVAKIDWCRSQEISFDLAGDETRVFTVSGPKNGWTFPVVVGYFCLGFIPERVWGAHYLWYLAIIPFAFVLYFVAIGRKKYLNLSLG